MQWEIASCKPRSGRWAFQKGSFAHYHCQRQVLAHLPAKAQRCPGARQCCTACSVLLFLFYKPGESEPEIPQSGRCRCQPVISFLIYCVSSFDHPCHMWLHSPPLPITSWRNWFDKPNLSPVVWLEYTFTFYLCDQDGLELLCSEKIRLWAPGP